MLTVNQLKIPNRLNGIDQTFAAGQRYAIIGPNGAGKSSLIQAITQTPERSWQGDVLLSGRSIWQMPCRQRAQHISVLNQKVNVLFNYSVADIIKMGLFAQRLTSATVDKVVQHIAEAFDLTGFLACCYHHLSGGQQQRVQLARVLAQVSGPGNQAQQRWLLLDEPVAHLDLFYQRQMLDWTIDYCQTDGIGVVLVIHDINLAARYADTMLLMHQGQIQATGPAKTVLSCQAFQKAFRVQATYLQEHDHYLIHG